MELLRWIDSQEEEMLKLVIDWAETNSYSDNLEGIEEMLRKVREAFSSLEAKEELIRPSSQRRAAPLLRLTKRPEAPIQLLLIGHVDTVYPKESPFQRASIAGDRLNAPGAADMKGGIVIMLKALEALERAPDKERVGWQVVINSDEETGSTGSEAVIKESCRGKHVGLIYEPSFANGAIVSSRKGSTNFTIAAKGKSAHAGRDFDKGLNAICHLIDCMSAVAKLNGKREGLTINLGRIEGGDALNTVPDFAACHCNARMLEERDAAFLDDALKEILERENRKEGRSLTLEKGSYRPPKPFGEREKKLFQALSSCASDLSQQLSWQPSGGVCDGNTLAKEGVATADTLGAIASGIHTTDEAMAISSLTERAKLSALFFLRLANGEIDSRSFSSARDLAEGRER